MKVVHWEMDSIGSSLGRLLILILLLSNALANQAKGLQETDFDSSNGIKSQHSFHEYDPNEFPNEFHDFIREQVIIPFQWQCSMPADRQFATLFFVAEKDLRNIEKTEFHPKDESGNVLVNSDYASFPKREHYGNYIVAQPEWLASGEVIHTEPILLDELPHLWNAFIKRSIEANKLEAPTAKPPNDEVLEKDYYPSYTVLYSWLMPCTDCTNVIIDTFTRYPYNATETVVVFTEYWRRESKEMAEWNKKRLKESGVRLVKVDYSRRRDEL